MTPQPPAWALRITDRINAECIDVGEMTFNVPRALEIIAAECPAGELEDLRKAARPLVKYLEAKEGNDPDLKVCGDEFSLVTTHVVGRIIRLEIGWFRRLREALAGLEGK